MLQLFVSLFYTCFLALMKTIILCLLPIIAFTLPQDNIVYEVIVIGAGLAGIGASKVLTDNQIPHLMIEGRSRIGGRVTDIEF